MHDPLATDTHKEKTVDTSNNITDIEQPETGVIWDISDIINSSNTTDHMDSSEFLIESLTDIFEYMVKKEYDLFTLEPQEEKVKIIFRKEKVQKEVFHLNYPVYNRILLRSKALTSLEMDETQVEQEWKGTTPIENKNYAIVSKTIPSALWEKILIKIKENKVKKKVHTKTSMGSIIGFLAVVIIIILIIWGAFMSFIVMNANTIDDVKFFSSMKISFNEINAFISKTVDIIFSSLVFLQTIFLAIFLFKFFITKKIYKKKKTMYAIFSIFLIMSSWSTGSGWMFLDKKIKGLPNWEGISLGKVHIYDNDKLINPNYTKRDSLLRDTSSLIWPITLKYDLWVWMEAEERKWFKKKKIIWTFWEESKTTIKPVTLYTFEKNWNYEVNITVLWINRNWEEERKTINNLQSVNISNHVKIHEKILNWWWKTVSFDARDLKWLWKIEWYTVKKWLKTSEEPLYTWLFFRPNTIVFDETIFWMLIQNDEWTNTRFDKIFVVWEKEATSIWWEIIAVQDPINDLKYTLIVKNPSTKSWNGFIEEFAWKIDKQVFIKGANIENIEESSKIHFTFSNYGNHTVSVTMRDSTLTNKIIKIDLDIPKTTKLKTKLRFYHEWKEKNNVRYEWHYNKYFMENVGAPTQITLDARMIRSSNNLYRLSKVSWDINGDGSEFVKEKKILFDIPTQWSYDVEVTYTFENKKIKWDTATIKETIYIEAIKKEAILDLKIEPESSYVPTTVRFDGSQSQVKWKNIQKFIFDYGDGTIEEGDGINPAHSYSGHGEYTIIMTAVTTDGTKHSITKKLILKPQPQKAKARLSLKRAEIHQGIDFSSDETEWQINTYFWDFWDGEVSTEANPTHSYEEPWTYDVSLKVNFSNNNTLTDKASIVIYE